MLSLRPPYLMSGDLMLFRDDKDESTFYYACQQPSICVSDNGTPSISAYAIIPESGIGVKNDNILEAGLTLDVQLMATQQQLDEAATALQQQYGVTPKVLSPAPLHDGKVIFTMAQSESEPEKSAWFVSSAVKPSMTGNNKASLVVRTTGDDAKLMIASVDAGSVPASVYYELKLVGIAPIYHASLTADMSLIYHHFQECEKDNYIFYTEDISNMVDDLQQSQAIEVHVEELDPDIKAEAMRTLFNELKSQVLETFFQPVELQSRAREERDSSIIDIIGRGVVNLVESIIPGRRYSRKNVDESQLKTITIDLSQSNAKTYTCCPQSLVKTMVDKAGITLSDQIAWIKLDDLANISQEVNVRVASDAFESANLKSIEVFCRVVDSTSDEVKMDVALPPFEAGAEMATMFNYHRQRGIDYCYEYRLRLLMDSGSNQLPDLLETQWSRVDSPYIFINPADYYTEYQVDVYLEDRSMFEQTQMVQVQVSAVLGQSETPVFSRSFVFKQEETEHRRFSVIAGRDANLQYNIKLTYFLANLKEHVVEYNDVESGLFFVPNPFENKWSVDIRSLVDWNIYDRMYLRTRVVDPNREDPIVNRFVFSKDQPDQVLYTACSLDTPQQKFDYYIELLPVDADKVVNAGWFTHDGGSVLIVKANEDFVPSRVLRFTMQDDIDFERYEIKYVELIIRYDDGGEDSRQLTPANPKVLLVHPVADSETSSYSYRYKIKCPGNPKSDWIQSDADNVVFSVDKNLL